MAKKIMIQGTMSNAGKSLIAAGLCRIFRQDGLRTAPFKSQNMALNSFVTPEGLEIGRAQAVQAEAAGVSPTADMNPILLKPTSHTGSQVIVHGIPLGDMSAREYFRKKRDLIPEVMASFRRLEEAFDVIVIEGAGSPAEINLRQDDIVNMGLAELVDSPVLLAGDIDRGGVFAQLYGTVMLLEERERRRIGGLLINKFRGDSSLLDSGITKIEELLGIPVLGLIPMADIDIDDEDSLSSRLAVHSGNRAAASGCADIAVIRLPRLSNFTDFHALEIMPGLSVRYVDREAQLGSPDMVILPGTKNTVEDFIWPRETGLENRILGLARKGTPVFGICGGFQMMGAELLDPEGTEGGIPGRSLPGMGLIPMRTVFRGEKVRTQDTGHFAEVPGIFAGLTGMPYEGYQIHMGVSECIADEGREGRFLLPEKSGDSKAMCGYARENIYGTYLHGIFDGEGIAAAVEEALCGKAPRGVPDYRAYREEQYDRLADLIRESLDMVRIRKLMGLD